MSPHKVDDVDAAPKPSSGRSWMMGAEAFERRMPHHDGIKALWETKWKIPCSKGLYPFHDGHYDDFEPIFAHLIAQEFLKRGWGVVVVEIPGTADCPADSADPDSPDRLWSSLLDWMGAVGFFDMARLMAWGLSSGGYYAVRAAHTHRARLAGCVAQGAGCHYFYDRQWLDRADGHEYPFKLSPAMAMKHGFDSVEAYREGAQKKFSLLETGILDQPSTRLLLVNGTLDGLMPIEDSVMLFEHGSPKEARFFTDALHMGYPKANEAVYPWMESVMASK
ncbi:hypothetical protein MAPG_10594 [Magnaporthiopsis poae ATCC 64411]|uniref:Peptidase S9 prolyl oligopeptidase catalytic domain-containing protein n=1 Tax=Magnaporthiopsis poae (strain ATCC 64411 / 73-15) TaxID=644358 RepID=A0A0C4ED03_MAGP6|nr:hypothetical protein MAPG_10594 [Magnaporthiopsis poae ATCC 64411]